MDKITKSIIETSDRVTITMTAEFDSISKQAIDNFHKNLQELIYKFRLKYITPKHQKDLRIYIPHPAIQLLFAYQNQFPDKLSNLSVFEEGESEYMGIKIHYNFENSVVLAYPEAVAYPKELRPTMKMLYMYSTDPYIK